MLPLASTHANNGARVSEYEVPKKLKQNINTVRILTLMVAIQDGSVHDMSPLKWGTITKLGVCPRSNPQAVTEHDAIG